jgi:hypothetical protein
VTDGPNSYAQKYSDLLYRAEITACQVSISPQASIAVNAMLGNIRPRWNVWYRLDGTCTAAQDCYSKTLDTVKFIVSNYDPRDVAAVDAKIRLDNVITPKFSAKPWEVWVPTDTEQKLGLPGLSGGVLRPLAAITLIMATPASHAAPSQCMDAKSVLFTCLAGSDVISVCREAGSVQYRFGPQGAPTMRLPPAGDWRTLVRAGVLTFAGGGGAYLAFTNGPYRYVVYTASARGCGKEKAGVLVEKNGQLVRNILCTLQPGTQQPVSELGPDLFDQGGFPKDPEELDTKEIFPRC